MRQAVIITGGAKRVGAALAVYFSEKGFDIALHYNNSLDDAKIVQKKVQELGRNCELFAADLQETSKIPALMAEIFAKMPHASTLINNAAVFQRAEFMETSEELFDHEFAVNFKAPFFLTQEFAKFFALSSPSPSGRGRGEGKHNVINILDTDISGNGGSHFAYILSKKNLAEFTKMAARALGDKVRVNGVCAGIMLASDARDEEYMSRLTKTLPLKQNARVEQVAEAVYFLSQNQAVTGQLLFIDGGNNLL